MNFLTAAKELKEAQALLAEKDAALTAANAELAKLKSDMEANAILATELSGKLETAEAQLTATHATIAKLETEAKETAAKIKQAAALESIATVAALGHEPVKTVVIQSAPHLDPKLTGLERAIAAHKLSKTQIN